jgi:hypothetical protein
MLISAVPSGLDRASERHRVLGYVFLIVCVAKAAAERDDFAPIRLEKRTSAAKAVKRVGYLRHG